MSVHGYAHVYLAGPILGCTQGEANDWRKVIAAQLLEHNIIGVSPLRCEPIIGDRYTASYEDKRFGTPEAIAAKNRFDVDTCVMGLYYIPKPVPTVTFDSWVKSLAPGGLAPSMLDVFEAGYAARKMHSFGTIIEMARANEQGKKTILVTDDPFLMAHPLVRNAADWKLDNFEDAVDVLVGVLGGYVGGKAV